MLQPTTYDYGPWLPDIPDAINPALPPAYALMWNAGQLPLAVAQNVIWTAGGYRPFLPLSAISAPLPAGATGAYSCMDSNGNAVIFAGTQTDLYKLSGTSWTKVSDATAWTASDAVAYGYTVIDGNGNRQTVTTAGTTGASAPSWNTTVGGTTTDGSVTWTLQHIGAYDASNWSFQVYGDCTYATNGVDAIQTINTTNGTQFGNLDIIDPAPTGTVLGVIRDFLFAGNTTDSYNGHVPNRVQWSALANPDQWPTPDTQNAWAAQAGGQVCYSEYGPIQYIGDGENFGLIFQQSGIVSASYVGGNTVFEFQTFDKHRGAAGINAVTKVGERYYFLAPDGFCLTDGSSVQPIGYQKVNKWFLNNVKQSALAQTFCAADTVNKLIYWLFQSAGGSGFDSLVIYNYAEDKFTYAQQVAERLFPLISNEAWVAGAFSGSHAYGQFTGSAGTAQLDTLDLILAPGRRSYINGARPLADGSPTMAVCSRVNQGDAVSFISYVSPSTRNRVCPFRSTGYYQRLSLRNTGSFNNLLGASILSGAAGD